MIGWLLNCIEQYTSLNSNGEVTPAFDRESDLLATVVKSAVESNRVIFVVAAQEDNMGGLSLDAWKGMSMGVFTAVSILGAIIAVVMKERAKQLYVSCGVLFSAGVLLSGGFVHLLGDAAEQLDLQETNSV